MSALAGLRVRARLALPRSALAWLVVAFLVHGAVLRVLSAPSVRAKWANTHERHSWAAFALGLSVGALEDVCVCVAAAIPLWLLGAVTRPPRLQGELAEPTSASSSSPPSRSSSSSSSPTALAALVAIHFVLANAAFCVDLVFLRTRRMRFSWDFVVLAWREDGAWAQLEVDESEWRVACEMAAVTLLFALALALRLDDRAVWRSHYALAEWDHQLWRALASTRVVKKCSHVMLAQSPSAAAPPAPPQSPSVRLANDLQEQDADDVSLLTHTPSASSTCVAEASSSQSPLPAPPHSSPPFVVRLARLVTLWFAMATATVTLVKWTPSLVAMTAWNASLCEPLRVLVGVECMATRLVHIGKRLRELIDTTTEKCTFVENDDGTDTLVRRTLGFTGPTAFDVAVEPLEKPNVLIVVIESFRQRDSRYLQQQQHLDAFLPGNVSLTPHFDQWAQRGIGFRSMWSSWRTSRSLEQILFGQLPLDSATDSGTSNGRTTVKLSGLPQLLRAKGYETLFTTGSRLDYDEWDEFLPSHGFDTCLHGWDLADIAQEELGIDWTRGDHMMAYWGMHDDLTFEVLGHELKKKQRAKRNGTGQPWFATHYTISSHVPFDERPDWFFRFSESNQMPDLSPLYASIEDPEIYELVKNYAEMRYFSDLAFGSFMGDLERSSVLNDTIVIVTGDHGHSPENGAAMPEEDQVGAMNIAAALIAEGRLGANAGMVIDNVTAQYDWLNTIADIVGLPDDGKGFLQTGVGRSLKRKPLDENRVVYSHNPALNLAAVQGHTRMEFYADVPDVVRVFNIDQDPSRFKDLRNDIPKSRLREIERICDEGRALNAYFTQRWQANCLLPPNDCLQAPPRMANA